MKESEVSRLVNAADSVALVSHTNPDGDAIGSLLALGMGLKRNGKTVWLLGDTPLPAIFHFLPGTDLYGGDLSGVVCDLVIYLDCASYERAAAHPLRYTTSLSIDHHADNTHFADYNWVDPQAAATGEMVYELLRELHIEVDQAMATCLYAAIASDTGWFAYENTRFQTHQISAELLKAGVQPHRVAGQLQLGRKYPALKLLGCALLSLKLEGGGKVAVMVLRRSDYERLGARLEDANGIVQYGGMLRDVEVSVLLKESAPSEIAVSLRSFGDVNVQTIASALGGGGHVKASGCTIHGDLDVARRRVLDVIGEAFGAGRSD